LEPFALNTSHSAFRFWSVVEKRFLAYGAGRGNAPSAFSLDKDMIDLIEEKQLGK
jgi:homoserine dehydrogenase